jgi:tetratricopeptide (TPR) repeat protein
MFLWLICVMGLSSLQSSFARTSGNPKLALAERMNSQGLYRFALDSLNDVIDKGLGDPDVYSFRGTVLSLRGEYDHAIHDFETGLESERLNGRDGESYAFVRFVQGDCTATDALQTLRYFGTMHKAASIRLLSTEVEMHRYCQDTHLAHQKQIAMAAQFPQAVKTHLAAADLALDEGNLELAWRHLFNSQIHYRYVGVRDILARTALVEGRYEDAFQILQYIKAQRVSDRSMILKGLATLMAGDPSVLLHKLSQPRWSDNENPHLIYLRLWAIHDLSLTEEYQEELEWFRLVCDSGCRENVERNLTMEVQQQLPFQVVEP